MAKILPQKMTLIFDKIKKSPQNIENFAMTLNKVKFATKRQKLFQWQK